MDEVIEIIEKHEVPKDLFDAFWEAYAAGVKRGFIEGAISVFNESAKAEALCQIK